MFCDSNKPVLIWDENNRITITSDMWYDWRSADFLSAILYGRGDTPTFYTKNGKIYWYNGDGNSYLLPRGQDYEIDVVGGGTNFYPVKPVQEYKHVMRKKRMAEIRSMFKPFYQYMQAVLAVDPEFGKSYDKPRLLNKDEFEDRLGISPKEFASVLRNPTDDPSIMKQMLIKCTTKLSMKTLNYDWKTNALGHWHLKDTRVGFKQAKEQFEEILKVFYFNEVFEYVPIEIGKEVHDLNAKYGYSKWNSETSCTSRNMS
tara:strand:- start:184 stop:957 length:774 start_codon:yes stop_codon:yes gene_type:complete